MLNQLNKHKYLIGIFVIIVVILIFIKEKGFKKISENFENANLVDVINGLDIQDQKISNIVDTATSSKITFSKAIRVNNRIDAGGDITAGNGKVLLGGNGDIKAGNNLIGGNGVIYTDTMIIRNSINSVGGDTKAGLSKTDIKKMKSLKCIAGYAINGDGTTHMLFDGYHKLHENKFMWAQDRWDTIYIFKGWKVTTWDGANKAGVISDTENKNEDVKMVDVANDRISEYEVKWVDY